MESSREVLKARKMILSEYTVQNMIGMLKFIWKSSEERRILGHHLETVECG